MQTTEKCYGSLLDAFSWLLSELAFWTACSSAAASMSMSSKASCSKTSWHGWRSTCFMLWLIPVTITRQNFEGYVSAHLVRFWPVELPARCSWGWFPWYRYLEISWMSDCWVLTILVGFKIMFPFLGLLNPNAHWSILHVQTSPIFSSFHARELNGFSAWQCAEKAFCKCKASETMCRYLRARARYFRISFLASGLLDMLRWHHGPQCVHGQLNQTWSGWTYATRSKSNLRSLTLLKSWPCSNPNLMLTFPMILSKVWDNSAFPVNTSIKPTGQSSLLACGPNRSWIINHFWQGHASAGMFQLVKGMLDGFTWLRTKGTIRGTSTQSDSSYKVSMDGSWSCLWGSPASCRQQHTHCGSVSGCWTLGSGALRIFSMSSNLDEPPVARMTWALWSRPSPNFLINKCPKTDCGKIGRGLVCEASTVPNTLCMCNCALARSAFHVPVEKARLEPFAWGLPDSGWVGLSMLVKLLAHVRHPMRLRRMQSGLRLAAAQILHHAHQFHLLVEEKRSVQSES